MRQKDEVFLTLSVHKCPVAFQGIGDGVGYEANDEVFLTLSVHRCPVAFQGIGDGMGYEAKR